MDLKSRKILKRDKSIFLMFFLSNLFQKKLYIKSNWFWAPLKFRDFANRIPLLWPAIGSIFWFPGRIKCISSFIGPENLKIRQNLFISIILTCNSLRILILIKICFYYKNNSDLIFSHKISDENWDFALFKSKNALKFIPSNSLRARKIADQAESGRRAAFRLPLS